MSDNPAKLWHLAKADKKIGTFTSQQLADMGKAGQITSPHHSKRISGVVSDMALRWT